MNQIKNVNDTLLRRILMESCVISTVLKFYNTILEKLKEFNLSKIIKKACN